MAQAFSVLIIVKGRKDHLLNVLEGIKLSNEKPAEVIVVHMNEPKYELHDIGTPVRQLVIEDTNLLPLARARNAAANAATSDVLVFLDVDCIPDPACFKMLLKDAPKNTVAMVDPQYLSQPVISVQIDTLQHDSVPNPARKNVIYGKSDRYELFWSLGFAIHAEDFAKVNFDEQFIGYGGEDTDFAFNLRKMDINLCYSKAIVYHQPHASCDPPLNWLKDIAVNAQVFKNKWGTWAMEGWLRAFEDRGYIVWSDDAIEILKLPTYNEIKDAERTNAETIAQ